MMPTQMQTLHEVRADCPDTEERLKNAGRAVRSRAIHLDHLRVMAAAAIVALSGCGTGALNSPGVNVKPAFLGTITKTDYNGVSDDLLTAGLGKSGLSATTPPLPANPAQPTPTELRRLVIYNNYRALVDTSPTGGYGTLYGPNIDVHGNDTLAEGKIAGTEYLAYADNGSGNQNVTMLVQVPDSFNPAAPCIVTATSSGSRGVYGAIGTAGEWGLKRGCAVAYNDKGTGLGMHDLQNNTVHLQNGTRSDAAAAGKASHFTANLSAVERQAFNAATPNRFAIKHAHSQQNPEKDWGKWTLQSIEFAFYVLNEQFGRTVGASGLHLRTLTPDNTLVIASSVSNGATAAIAAAEQDKDGLIDGVAVSEPNLPLAPDARLRVVRGARTWTGTGRVLYDYISLANLMQPCASLAPSLQSAPFRSAIDPTRATNRCHALRANGLISGATTEEMANNALSALTAAGWEAEHNELHPSLYALATPAIMATYSNAYGRFSVKDNVCGISFGATLPNGTPTAAMPVVLAQSYGTGTGIPPTAGITLINNNSVGGPLQDALSISPSTGQQDYNIDAALCHRELIAGNSPQARRVQQGVGEVLLTGNLRGKPTLIVHGRSDAWLPPAFSSRPYFGINKIVEGNNSKLSYIEVTHAQHFESLINAVPGYATRFVPLHGYYLQALDMMYAHLKSGAALPPSQLVRTTPRGADAQGNANPLRISNVPAIQLNPPASERITFADNTVTVPD